ncbi:uncharacterized protein LOC108153784 [Drosophila miranda]|uniref:uncharacterized protein LOC108153784 n=1 Tax=Drosophila miranda TaxID=7229 RepID=UPI0007E8535F|nr:uncharacterized protein LOC108153784 [Drosophila miranda]
MFFSECIEQSCGVGRPNPNFQRLIPFIEPPSDEYEGPGSKAPAPLDFSLVKIQQDSYRLTIPHKPSGKKPFEDFVRATIVDVDPLTGGPWLRHKIIYRSSPRKVQPHSSLKRRQKMTNLVTSTMLKKSIPENFTEPLENTDREMKVLWRRGQSPPNNFFNLEPRPAPAMIEILGPKNPLETESEQSDTELSSINLEEFMYSSLPPFLSGVDPIDMPCRQTTVHVRTELIYDISGSSIQQSIEFNHLEEEFGPKNMLDDLDTQEPCEMRSRSESACKMFETDDSLMELGPNSITTELIGDTIGGSINHQPPTTATTLDEVQQHMRKRVKVTAEKLTKKLESLAEQLPRRFQQEKSVSTATQLPECHPRLGAGAVSTFLMKNEAACQRRRVVHCRPIVYEPLCELYSAVSVTVVKPTPKHQANGSQRDFQKKEQTSGASLTLFVERDTLQALDRGVIPETDEPSCSHA